MCPAPCCAHAHGGAGLLALPPAALERRSINQVTLDLGEAWPIWEALKKKLESKARPNMSFQGPSALPCLPAQSTFSFSVMRIVNLTSLSPAGEVLL